MFRKARRSKRERDIWASLPARNDAFDTATARADLLAALGELPERQRAIVVARYFYGLSYDEICRTLRHQNSGTVRATLGSSL